MLFICTGEGSGELAGALEVLKCSKPNHSISPEATGWLVKQSPRESPVVLAMDFMPREGKGVFLITVTGVKRDVWSL